MSKPASTSRPSDEVAIRSLYQQLMDGWNRGSGEAFAAPFAEDGDLVGFDGTYLKGRQEIISFHQQLFRYLRQRQPLGWKDQERTICDSCCRHNTHNWRDDHGRSDRHRTRTKFRTNPCCYERQ